MARPKSQPSARPTDADRIMAGYVLGLYGPTTRTREQLEAMTDAQLRAALHGLAKDKRAADRARWALEALDG